MNVVFADKEPIQIKDEGNLTLDINDVCLIPDRETVYA